MEASEEIGDAKPEALAEPTQGRIRFQEAEQSLSRMSRRSRKAGVERQAEASKVEEDTEELEADVTVEPIKCPLQTSIAPSDSFWLLDPWFSFAHVGGCRF